MHTINDARWQEWADKFLAAPKEPMSPKASELFVRVCFNEAQDIRNGNFCTIQNVNDESIPFVMRVGIQHGLRVGLKATCGLITFGAFVSGGVGQFVMYIHAFRRIQQKTGSSLLTVNDVVMNGFEAGFASSATLTQMWDLQKAKAGEVFPQGNYLDAVVDPAAVGA